MGWPLSDTGGAVARVSCIWVALALLLFLPACKSTVDSLGYDGPDRIPLRPLTGPSTYPNAFRDLLGKTDAEIAAKIAATFAQLFHGDPVTQAIYVPIGTDRAAIQDILHNDVRTEGLGFAMLIAVELDKRDELDRIWTYAKTLQNTTGPSSGYFRSFCEVSGVTSACLDPFGLQQMVMALVFANDRYGRGDAGAPTIDYAADVRALLNLMRHKQDQNGGIVGGVTNTFDGVTSLVLDAPNLSSAGIGRPAIEMPAYYDLWAQATGDPFWTEAAVAGRSYWQRTAQPVTGLMPVRATFAGAPVAGDDTFTSESYRTQLSMTLDQIWSVTSVDHTWTAGEGDRLLRFFVAQGIDTYGSSFTLDGTTVLNATHDPSLVAMNGVSALTSTVAQQTALVDAVWNLETPTGLSRYYSGLLDLLAQLALGGQFRVW